jgi:acetaldehyde dehydrogenase (acetylating)
MSGQGRLKVAIIGTGNIGTDLMFKIERSPRLELAGVAGIDPSSPGLQLAREHGHAVSETGLAGLLELVPQIDLAFDATSARTHAEHARVLAERGIRSVDLTPAAIGPAIVPPVNLAA